MSKKKMIAQTRRSVDTSEPSAILNRKHTDRQKEPNYYIEAVFLNGIDENVLQNERRQGRIKRRDSSSHIFSYVYDRNLKLNSSHTHWEIKSFYKIHILVHVLYECFKFRVEEVEFIACDIGAFVQ